MQSRFPHAYVLNVVSDDHPGIVAAVSRAVAARGGNIDAVSQTVLGGYFSLITVVSFPHGVEPEALQRETAGEPGTGSGLQATVRRFEPPDAPAPAEAPERFVLTAIGVDRPGIVLAISEALAARGVNIVDLQGEHRGDDFLLICQVEVPAGTEVHALRADLEAMAGPEGLAVHLQHENVFVATNQLQMNRPRPPTPVTRRWHGP